MGCCLSKKASPSSSSPSGVSPDPNKSAIDKPLKPETEAQAKKLEVEESKPKNEAEIQENINPRKEVFVIKHRRSHERSKTTTTDPEDSTASEEKSTGTTNQTPADVDAILIQCGRLSRSNSAAAKTRRYSGSKRSFDFDKNERSRDGDADEADAEDGGEEEAERRIHRQRQRGGGESPRERRRRTPSREREDSKSYRSGSRERGSGSRRVSRSPGRRSETNNPNPNSCAGSGSSVNSSNNNRPAKFVSVPATDKASLVMEKSNNNAEASIKRVTVKRNVASPRSQSPARAASPRAQSPARVAVNTSSNAQPSPSKLRRKTEHSPYRRNPLGEIDPNSLAFPQPQGQKMNAKTGTQAPIRRSASPSRVTKEQQEAVEECKIVVSGTEIPKPQIMSRSRSLRKSRDFDFSPEALLSNNIDNNNNNAPASYAALLLEDIQNFHQKSVNVNAISSSMSKACSIVEAVSDLNSTTNKHQRSELNNFTSAAAVKKADLMEPSFEKYVTVKRGGSSLEDMEDQESSGSNSITGSSCVVQRKGYSTSSSWEPNSAESTDRVGGRSSNKERDRSPFGVQEFDPLKKNGVGAGGKRVATTTRVATVSV
ncbi:PREDICTED: uncharacterized protein At1g65710 [Brassica oleracea var. oleracea]|uniref:Uncharacterized protein n=1 Tax=Brassica oleracea var. oleracea TaxID=109376 RepID=A0A0D3BZD8_BRAOL|nr:PREDICTED: uncharacterized protein At1g65710 [Brassica oleracea var. oleracea]